MKYFVWNQRCWTKGALFMWDNRVVWSVICNLFYKEQGPAPYVPLFPHLTRLSVWFNKISWDACLGYRDMKECPMVWQHLWWVDPSHMITLVSSKSCDENTSDWIELFLPKHRSKNMWCYIIHTYGPNWLLQRIWVVSWGYESREIHYIKSFVSSNLD
jgi:hypothetical protein